MRGWRIYQGEDAMKMISMLMLGAMVAGAVTGAGTDTAAGATVASSAKRTVSLVGPRCDAAEQRRVSNRFRPRWEAVHAGRLQRIDPLPRLLEDCGWHPGSDSRRVSYQISPHSGRTIAVVGNIWTPPRGPYDPSRERECRPDHLPGKRTDARVVAQPGAGVTPRSNSERPVRPDRFELERPAAMPG